MKITTQQKRKLLVLKVRLQNLIEEEVREIAIEEAEKEEYGGEPLMRRIAELEEAFHEEIINFLC